MYNTPSLSKMGLLLAAEETTIGIPVAIDASKQVFEVYNAEFTSGYNKVSREQVRPTLTRDKDITGIRESSFTFRMYLKGYSLKGARPKMGIFFKSCGMSEYYDINYSKYTFTDNPAQHKTLTLRYYYDGKMHEASGCRGQFTLLFENGQPVFVDFTYNGLWNEIEFRHWPKLIVDDYIIATNMALTDSFKMGYMNAPKYSQGRYVKSLSIVVDNGLKRRDNVNSNEGFTEYQITKRDITGNLIMEIFKGNIDINAEEIDATATTIIVSDTSLFEAGDLVQDDVTGETFPIIAILTATTMTIARNSLAAKSMKVDDNLNVLAKKKVGASEYEIKAATAYDETTLILELTITDGLEVGNTLLCMATGEVLLINHIDGVTHIITVTRGYFNGYIAASNRTVVTPGKANALSVAAEAKLEIIHIFQNISKDIVDDRKFHFEILNGATGMAVALRSFVNNATGYSKTATDIKISIAIVDDGYLYCLRTGECMKLTKCRKVLDVITDAVTDYPDIGNKYIGDNSGAEITFISNSSATVSLWEIELGVPEVENFSQETVLDPGDDAINVTTITDSSQQAIVVRNINKRAQALNDGDEMSFVIFNHFKSINLDSGYFDITGNFVIEDDPIEDDEGVLNHNLALRFVGAEVDGNFQPCTEFVINHNN